MYLMMPWNDENTLQDHWNTLNVVSCGSSSWFAIVALTRGSPNCEGGSERLLEDDERIVCI